MRVFINGFGRIGRSVLRAWLRTPSTWPMLEIVGINDIASPEMAAYLFEFDSTFGVWPQPVRLEAGKLIIGDRALPLTSARHLTELDLSSVDVVMECTGRGDQAAAMAEGLHAGARQVLISGPSKIAEATVVIGANDAVLGQQKIISNASCTTNALAPLARRLHECFGLRNGWMTTVHCYTSSQPTIDAPGPDFARSRAAALSIVPTTTSASRLVDHVLPELAGRIEGAALRVPVASVSCVDLTVTLDQSPTLAEVNACLSSANGVIGTTDRPLVSTDLRARPESIVMALPETRVTAGGLVRVFGWYDNEWGFSNRMLDMAMKMQEKAESI